MPILFNKDFESGSLKNYNIKTSKKIEITWRKHPGIWFSLWTIETLFLLSFLFTYLDLTGFWYNISQLFVRIWAYICIWWITIYHIRWLEKLDKNEYIRQKEKEK